MVHPPFSASSLFSLKGAIAAIEKIGAAAISSMLGGFTSIEGIGWKTEVRTVREGGNNSYEHKLPGHATCNELVFSKGLTLVDPLWEWYRLTAVGTVLRMNGTILLMNDLHSPTVGSLPSFGAPTAAWNFYNAWPTALEGVNFDASQSLVAVQRLTLAIDRIEKAGVASVVSAVKSLVF
jgi:phage tail-like protein